MVSAAETSWTLPVWHDADAPGAPWPETGDDETIARMLQHAEQRSFIAVSPVVRGGGGRDKEEDQARDHHHSQAQGTAYRIIAVPTGWIRSYPQEVVILNHPGPQEC